MTRRDWLTATAGLAATALAGCGARYPPTVRPDPTQGFGTELMAGLTVLTRGPADAPGVVVLHELPGLTVEDLRLATRLAAAGLRVFVPVLFGKAGQDDFLRGYFQACVSGKFRCGARSARSDILDRLEPLCDRLATRTGRPVGAIGMCLTGILPLTLLANRVTAAVLCQPTVPFSILPPHPAGRQRADLGLGADDLREAYASNVPFLTIHYRRIAVARLNASTRSRAPHIPGGSCAARQAVMQACLHSHGHRAPVCEAAPSLRRRDAADGFHLVADRTPTPAVISRPLGPAAWVVGSREPREPWERAVRVTPGGCCQPPAPRQRLAMRRGSVDTPGSGLR